jgi:hypothetical protein
MDDYLEALAQSFRNMGIEAETRYDGLMVDGCRIYAWRGRGRASFEINNVRITKRTPIGEALAAVLAVLPSAREDRDRYRAAQTVVEQAKELTEQFKGIVKVTSYNSKLELEFSHVDPAMMLEICQLIKNHTSHSYDFTNREDRLVAADEFEERGYVKWAQELRK